MESDQVREWVEHPYTKKLVRDWEAKRHLQAIKLRQVARCSADAEVREAAKELAATEVFLCELLQKKKIDDGGMQ